jgi:hypothetical protein
LQAAASLLVVWWRPPAQGLPREGERLLKAGVLQHNCLLAEGESAHPANYCGYSHAREVLRVRKSRATSKTTARAFSSKFTTQTLSFAAVLRGEMLHNPAL